MAALSSERSWLYRSERKQDIKKRGKYFFWQGDMSKYTKFQSQMLKIGGVIQLRSYISSNFQCEFSVWKNVCFTICE